ELVILRELSALAPKVPIVSEESAEPGVAALGDCFFLVDPLDGTREFLAGRDEYTVHVAIIRNGSPLAGVVCAPAQGTIRRGFGGKRGGQMRVGRAHTD